MAGAATALAVSLGAGAAAARPDVRTAEPGVTPTSITIGGTVPLSGIASAYASVGRGADAYFKYVNARGGVNGRKIVYRFLDDAYNPASTVQQTRQLVQGDRVFAIYNSLGTEHNLAIRPFLNQAGVPHVFAATGASTFGRDYKRYPWTIGYQPSYVAEGAIYGRYLASRRSGARIAVLFQNDDYGRDVIAGLQSGLGTKGKIVAQAGYEVSDTDVGSQITTLKASGAGVLVIVATPAFAVRAYVAVGKLGWKPAIFVNAVGASTNTMKTADASSGAAAESSISIAFLKDPSDPQWTNDPGGRLYRQIMKRYGSGDVNDVYNVYAMASAHSLVTALGQAGKSLTRRGLLRALTSLNERDNPFLLPGITVRTSASDRFPIEQARLQRWTKGRWVSFGSLLAARG